MEWSGCRQQKPLFHLLRHFLITFSKQRRSASKISVQVKNLRRKETDGVSFKSWWCDFLFFQVLFLEEIWEIRTARVRVQSVSSSIRKTRTRCTSSLIFKEGINLGRDSQTEPCRVFFISCARLKHRSRKTPVDCRQLKVRERDDRDPSKEQRLVKSLKTGAESHTDDCFYGTFISLKLIWKQRWSCECLTFKLTRSESDSCCTRLKGSFTFCSRLSDVFVIGFLSDSDVRTTFLHANGSTI